MISVSFTDSESQSIFHQEVSPISCFAGADFIADLQKGYEIELSMAELASYVDYAVPQHLETFGKSCSVWLMQVRHDFRVNIVPFGGELFHMLHNGKPLSAFSMAKCDDEDAMLRGQAFAEYVEKGVIARHEYYVQGRNMEIKYLLFYLPGEEWRIDVYASLTRHMCIARWTDHLERIESFLLGYPIEPRRPLDKE